jgi:hypothetical protein
VTARLQDVVLTADLCHHPAGEHLLAGTLPALPTPALVDVAHWASEHPWCEQAASVIRTVLAGTVDTVVSWRIPTRGQSAPRRPAQTTGRTQEKVAHKSSAHKGSAQQRMTHS